MIREFPCGNAKLWILAIVLFVKTMGFFLFCRIIFNDFNHLLVMWSSSATFAPNFSWTCWKCHGWCYLWIWRQNRAQSEHTPSVKRLSSHRAVPWQGSKQAVLQSIWYLWHLTWAFLFNFRNLDLSHQGAVHDKHFETSQRSAEKLRKEENLNSCYYW